MGFGSRKTGYRRILRSDMSMPTTPSSPNRAADLIWVSIPAQRLCYRRNGRWVLNTAVSTAAAVAQALRRNGHPDQIRGPIG